MADQGSIRWAQDPDGNWHAVPGPTPPPVSTSTPKIGCGAVFAVLLVVGFVVWVVQAALGALGLVDNDDSGTSASSTGSSDDAGAFLACRHFRNIAADWTDGQLTLVELRGKLQEVAEDANAAESLAVRTAARDMVAEVTAGDLAGLASAVTRMGSACTATGN